MLFAYCVVNIAHPTASGIAMISDIAIISSDDIIIVNTPYWSAFGFHTVPNMKLTSPTCCIAGAASTNINPIIKRIIIIDITDTICNPLSAIFL